VEVVIIDTPPHADAAAREAVRKADLVLVPTRPRPFDLHALEATAELIAYARKPAFVILNGVLAGATRLLGEAREYIEDLGLGRCPLHSGSAPPSITRQPRVRSPQRQIRRESGS
jgi:chromosome partitioning protein